MVEQLRYFFIALTFLTRIKTPLKGDVTQQQMGYSIIYYPLVGIFIGIVLYLVSHVILFFSSDFSADVLAAIVLSVWLLITGGLHLDGLADSADAWIGGQNDRQRTLDIMKDPYCGPMGVALIVLLLLLKWSALSYLLNTQHSAFLIVLPLLSRSIIIVLFMSTAYVRDAGLGSALLDYMPDESILWTVLFVSVSLYLIFASALSLLMVVVMVFILRQMMIQRLGGMTGDTLGACVEIAEAVALVGLVF